MDATYYQKYEPIFGAWTIKRKLGEGNFGSVFEIEREDFGTTYRAALKTITIPKSQAELDSILDDGMDATSAEQYLEQFVEKIVGEFVLMSKLKGNSHIVSYEDHQVIKHENGIGWDILIRMELLTPMMTYIKSNSITKRDVIKLGIDMCRALELCQKYNIIHRDIKPENIFISDSGDFKLGDFGIAKEVEKTQSGLTKTGTQTYMAPEVYKGQPYGSSVDMYSLGIVLYRLLNHNRVPFMPQYPNPISYKDRERALIMRMGGHKFPMPSNVSGGRLAEIALKACSFKPEDRYSSPTQMREDLEAILYTEGEGVLMFPSGDNIEIKSVEYITGSSKGSSKIEFTDDATEIIDDATEIIDDVKYKNFGATKPKKKGKGKLITSIALICILLVGGLSLFMFGDNKTEESSLKVASVQELNEPVEFKIDRPTVTEADYEIIVKRLESYGAKYYMDKGLNTIVMSKSDLGNSTQEALATIHMLTGKGEIKVTNSDESSEYTLDYSDFASAEYQYDETKETSLLTLNTTDEGKSKLHKLTEQIVASETEELKVLVDGNVRLMVNVDKIVEDGKIIISQKEGSDKTLLASLTDMFLITAHAADVNLSSNYMKLIVSFVNDGILTYSYEIYIDEKYGLVLPEETEEPEITEEPEQTDEPVAEEKPATTKPSTSTKKPTTQAKPSTQTQQKPVQQQPAQQQPVQQQPVQQQPVQQQPQQTTPPASNPAGMPEVYIDFD